MSRALADTPAIGWYPGHMAVAMRRLADDLKISDVVVEVADARLPRSGRNPSLVRMAGARPRLLVLSRADLADGTVTRRWLDVERATADVRAQGTKFDALAVDAKNRGGAQRLRAALVALARDGRNVARAIVVGIPNAGKSTVINALAGRTVARAEDRAGVTRARQWFRTGGFEVMDTAGILVPKIETAQAQWKLALIGAVPRARFDAEDVVERLVAWHARTKRGGNLPDLATFAQSRGFVRRGTIPDVHNAAWAYLSAWGDGSFGRMTLETPEDA